jgi:HlyD family secretion protein
MNRKRLLMAIPVAIAAALLAVQGSRRLPQHPDAKEVLLSRGPLSVWSVYEGTLDSRHVELIMSQFSGSATIVDLVPEGTSVRIGDPLVRFDGSEVQRELLKLDRDAALARTELESLERAALPLELRGLELQVMETQANYDAEKQFLDDSIPLVKEDLVSQQEIDQQKLKLARLASVLDKQKMEFDLTRTYLHPSRIERARATSQAAEQERHLMRQQLTNCAVRAPCAGTVVYRAIQVGTEFRTVRIGDSIYKNQPFIAIPDMSNLVVHCLVPESELSCVGIGDEAIVTPAAFPDLRLSGRIESVASMAQTVPGRGTWLKYFPVVVAIQGHDTRLRSGMSVQARVLSYRRDDALRIPRAAVWWDDGQARCLVREGLISRPQDIAVGRADGEHYEVLDGLAAGTTVLRP